MKAVVVDIKDEYAAVLSDDGSIVKVKNRSYSKGQVIEMKKKINFTKKFALGVASIAVLVLSSSVGAWAYTTPYSYVSLDVNPSIEYTLNRFERVIDIKAVNDDGKVILDQIDIKGLKNQSIEDAIIDTVEQISQDGYFEDKQANVVTGSTIQIGDATKPVITIDGGIVITVANGNTKISDELAKEIRESVEDFVDKNVESENVEVEVSSIGYERVQKARELGVTPGKLNLVEKLQASAADPDSIVLEDWLNKPVKDIMKAIKENRKAVLATENGDTSKTTETSETTETTIADGSENASTSKDNAVEDSDATVKKVKTKQEKTVIKKQEKKEKEELKEQGKKEKEKIKEQEKVKKEKIKEQEKAEKEVIKKQEKTEKENLKEKEKTEKAITKKQEKTEKEIMKEQEKTVQKSEEKTSEKKNKADEKSESKEENKSNSSKPSDNASKEKSKK